MHTKEAASISELMNLVKDGDTIIAGGFGLSGIPEKAILALAEKEVKDLTIVSNNCGVDDWGLGLLLENRQIKKIMASYVGENKLFEQQYLNGELEVELVPQGTLAERIRAGGAGIPGFYTPTGVGTKIAEGKEVKEFNGQPYILERAITGDIGLVKAWKGERYGNLIYRMTAQNFNPLAAAASKVTVAEVEELVGDDDLDPNFIHTPGIYVQHIVEGKDYEKRIERRTVREKQSV